ncbi:MAG: energy-coupling factor transporter ATPase [Clostridia bacterium]|nr:energy-coupling factor transporter ATPase [Clostridia bacterium]
MSIKVVNLNHIYDKGLPTEHVALSDVSFEANDGEIIGIVGHTGSGKSTLLEHLNGLLKPTQGKIYVDDVDITEPKVSMVQIRRKVGLVFQYPEYQLFEETVVKDICYGPKNLGLSEEECLERAKEALKLVGLSYDEIGNRSPFDLSGGQKRRVAIAGILAMRPEVLILDEPTAGLDPKAHNDVIELVKEVHRRTGNTTIIVSHNMQDIAQLSDRVLVLHKGKVVAFDKPEVVFSNDDALEAIGLDMPPISEFCQKLGIPGIVMDMDTAVEKIKERFYD